MDTSNLVTEAQHDRAEQPASPTYFVVQWSLTPSYAEFCGVPEGSHSCGVVAADSVSDALVKAMEPTTEGWSPDPFGGEYVSAVWTVGDSPVWDSDARLLEAYFDGSEDAVPERLQYDPEEGQWYWIGPKKDGPGADFLPLTVVVWGYDPRTDTTDVRTPEL